MTKPTHHYTIFTEMMTRIPPNQYAQKLKTAHLHTITEITEGSLIYLEQFQNRPIGIPKLMKMHLKTFEHPRTSCFRENPPPD